MSMSKATTIDKTRLVEAARNARKKAYAPYSNYHVGAALLTEEGETFTGCNVENAAYPAAICAERVAITSAVAEGYQSFAAIVIATDNGGSPCGICRQVMNEFAPDMSVILADDERIVLETTVSDLLPHGFSPEQLP